ncbi:MAG: sulfotransferase [Sphingomonadaceae bacterium]|nr:sulfotransferase [Sphingomonadaceae bacterium]
MPQPDSQKKRRRRTLRPILVLGSARSGSTALMSLLGGSPRIAFDKRYPYESGYLSYLALVARMIGGQRPRDEEAAAQGRASLISGVARTLGPVPFDTRGYLPRALLSAEAMIGLWDGFSRAVIKRAIRAGTEEPTHFAEKAGFFLADFLEGKIDAQELYLLRDPRDVMLSSKSFNARRGTLRFGWRQGDTDTIYANRFARRVRKRLEAALAVEAGDPRRMMVRYEELALDPEGVAARLSEFLGIALDVGAQLAARAGHRTSASVAASVGRWRREMDPEIQAIFDEQLGDVLDRAGYGRAGPA